MTAHEKAGWRYSEYVGEFGGWHRDAGALEQVVCREKKRGGQWLAYYVRKADGATLRQSEHATRDAAMAALTAYPHVGE